MHDSWVPCITSSVGWLGSLITGCLLTLTIYLCNCMWKFSEAFILQLFCEGFVQPHDFINRVIFMTVVLHMPLVCYWILCMRCAQCISLLMFCGPGQHSGYSDLLCASLGCGIYHPPLPSAGVA